VYHPFKNVPEKQSYLPYLGFPPKVSKAVFLSQGFLGFHEHLQRNYVNLRIFGRMLSKIGFRTSKIGISRVSHTFSSIQND
jgi:hypothetical protein